VIGLSPEYVTVDDSVTTIPVTTMAISTIAPNKP